MRVHNMSPQAHVTEAVQLCLFGYEISRTRELKAKRRYLNYYVVFYWYGVSKTCVWHPQPTSKSRYE